MVLLVGDLLLAQLNVGRGGLAGREGLGRRDRMLALGPIAPFEK
jgi:hypothetical protein